MTAKKRKLGQPAPVWRAFMQAAWKQVAQVNGWDYRTAPALSGEAVTPPAMSGEITVNAVAIDDVVIGRVAAQIVAHGDGPTFLKAVRRGRSTHRQNLRYRLLRAVEMLCGDTVKRRRVDSNTPDAVALKAPENLTLEIQ